jgi:hypothetical protein
MEATLYDRESDIKRAEEIRRKLSERQQSDMAKVLSTCEGRRVIWRIMSDALPFNTPYAGVGNDSMTFLNIGKKEFALRFYTEIEANQPEQLRVMRSEAASDRLLREAESKGEKQNGKRSDDGPDNE